MTTNAAPDPIETAALIKAERMRLGLSLVGAAQACGMHRETYRILERSANPTVSTLAALHSGGFDTARILGVLARPPKHRPGKAPDNVR